MRNSVLAVSFLLLGAFPLDSAAVVAIECTAYASFDAVGLPLPEIVVDTTTDTCTAALSPSPVAMNSDGAGDLGFLLARAEYTRVGEIAIDDADTFAQTSFRDTIVVNSPGLAGQTVTIHATAFLNGVIDVTGTGEAAVTLIASPGGQLVFETCDPTSLCFGSFGYPRIVSEEVEVNLNAQVGASSSLKLTLTASGGNSGSGTAPGTALSDFGGAGGITWGGISEVTHQGAPVEYTITSESGTDWTQPVPEPDAVVAGLGAAVAIALLRKRASTRRRA